MHLRSLLGISLSYAFLVGTSAGCDVGKSSLGGGAGTASVSAGGSAATPPATTCSTSAECTEQICSPDGRCVDCYGDQGCMANQHCDAEHCVANGGDVGGSGGGGNGSGGLVNGGGSSGSGSGMCAGAQVLFVIQRSGTMFEEPEGDVSYWSMVRDATVAEGGALAAFDAKLAVGALFFVRVQDDDMACPVVSSAAPASSAAVPLRALFDTNQSAYDTLADEQAKMDAPVPEAVTAGAALLSGSARHLVLITTAVPDSCDLVDSDCTVDLAIKAVQDASQQGVTTHVIGLGSTDSLDAAEDDDGYRTYLTQLANAGTGKPVAMSGAFEEQCSDRDETATYAEQNGDAQPYQVETAAELKTAVAEILQRICP